ncbi:zinc/iron-chelating domain-containing protein [Desulfosarcina ovata subsp. sediminis]|uniref:Zinc/iron-chelating domain-containing protein n=1 Tax=Desulfosarcina ovata subsp. sediminis TaxID=885957 RepID=A0A5K7ZS79_9BACT|nr:YkgJ family cysteine cluster protein [Desulfosarcina ovata]BBO83054.1 zinc/iron-chelating domain-containing protein [Desulfosarcina ovata subsp. sediminis]
MLNWLAQRPYFFDTGIRFTCRRCGTCCTGAPGIVRVNARETAAFAAYLGLPISRVIETYLTPWEDGYRINETEDGRCLFFEDGCRVYPVRPTQCRTFPFWFRNLRSETHWKATQKACPGIGSGDYFSKDDILNILFNGMPQEIF